MSTSANTEVALTQHGNAVRFAVRVVPRSGRSSIEGALGGALKVRLAAPPVDGAANEALVAFLAGALGVPKRAVRIIRGERSKSKVVEVAGVTAATVRSAASAGG